MNQTTDADDPYITDAGSKCPAFVAERTFDAAPTWNIHEVTLAEPIQHAIGDQETVIRMLTDYDGGIVTYDDGTNIKRRVFDSPEAAEAAFRGTVVQTAEDYDRRGCEYVFEYDAGDFNVEFPPEL
jgi:hypothetical protein